MIETKLFNLEIYIVGKQTAYIEYKFCVYKKQ